MSEGKLNIQTNGTQNLLRWPEIKFVHGSIYDKEFIQKERARSEQEPTFALELNKTLGDWVGNKFILRPGIEKQIEILKANGVRLVLWTATPKFWVLRFMRQHPEFAKQFDLFITRENFCLGESSIGTDEIISAYLFIDPNLNERDVRKFIKDFRNVKDIAYLGYEMLVGDNSYVS